ncbi:MAG: bifunctional 4-hydroxy-2-oxoglutarate aldolase/2-dehydro-3-deoxy-phosphogluconate aldolase [Propionibacteriaceae bacterium]|jgi:2-dehydro-3-deoxyphosphogluconate aldolase/(4S)-4-hydroxy-2-oxoglutarate aldolase|nr:bifunctional 4-hydroxy-2-oxoglutarate aldolase/2-dehydro-3-deoxy-phosphogluconate aldolase [Propionibacteriaceae bacterium]
MMNDLIDRLEKLRVVPVVVIDDANAAQELGQAVLQGGLPVLEVTFRTQAAPSAIKILSQNPELFVGAGTVLNADQVDTAVQAGASFIVSPGFSLAVINRCRELGVPVLPGVATASDMMAAIAAGVEIVKFFPAGTLGGPGAIKDYAAPFPGIRFVPTGGITTQNVAQYLSIPQVLAVGGSWMVPRSAIAEGDFAKIATLVSQTVTQVRGL